MLFGNHFAGINASRNASRKSPCCKATPIKCLVSVQWLLEQQCGRAGYYCTKVLVKCRQNVANKLFISRYFNPVDPCILATKIMTALTAKCSERSHISKGGRGELFLSVEVQNLHTLLL